MICRELVKVRAQFTTNMSVMRSNARSRTNDRIGLMKNGQRQCSTTRQFDSVCKNDLRSSIFECVWESRFAADAPKARASYERPPQKSNRIFVASGHNHAIFSRGYTELRIFRLMGPGYVEVIGHGGRYWIPEAELGLGVWRGRHQGLNRFWLRWFDAAGSWIPIYEELAEQERGE